MTNSLFLMRCSLLGLDVALQLIFLKPKKLGRKTAGQNILVFFCGVLLSQK